jgi:hypothetical protein
VRIATFALLLAFVSPAWGQTKGTPAKDLGEVTFDLQHDGKPVATANVTLDDGKQKQDALVDPSAKGAAVFHNVKPGSLKVTVRYRAAGKDATPITQIFEAPAGKDAPHFTVALPEAAEVVGGPVSSPPAPSGPLPPSSSATAPAPSGGFNPVGTLFALLAGAAFAGGAWYFIKKNPEQVGGTLERLGAQIPKPGDAPLADPPVAPAPAADPPAPPQKIVLDPAPDPIQVPVVAAPISVAVSEPSLISDAGIPIPLAEGETVVGREVGLGLSLAGETTVSRRHATIVRTGPTVVVQDAGSTNGTFVNGTPATGPVALKPGDALQFGSVRFRYEG